MEHLGFVGLRFDIEVVTHRGLQAFGGKGRGLGLLVKTAEPICKGLVQALPLRG